MARNKKKTQAQHVSEDDEHSEHSGSDVAEPVADAASATSSNAGSDDSEAKAAKAKKQKRLDEIAARRNKKKGGKAQKGGGAAEDAKAEKKAKGARGSGDDDDDDDDGEDSDGELEVTRQRPVEVLYCPICTFPAEMCEFSGMMEKCRPWLQEHAAELADAEERGRKRRVLTEKERLEAMVEGRGIKKALERVVVLDVEKRVGKRMITSVYGMDLFGHNLKDLSKEWRKAFACGVGVRAPEEGKHQDCIDIQGSVEVRLGDMLVEKYDIPKEAIYIVRNKKKEKFF